MKVLQLSLEPLAFAAGVTVRTSKVTFDGCYPLPVLMTHMRSSNKCSDFPPSLIAKTKRLFDLQKLKHYTKNYLKSQLYKKKSSQCSFHFLDLVPTSRVSPASRKTSTWIGP